MATKKLTAEEKELKEAREKIEAKYAKLAKERLHLLNVTFWPKQDVLGMTDDDFINWLLPTMQQKNPSAYNSVMKARDAKKRRAEKAKERRNEKKQSISDNELLPH